VTSASARPTGVDPVLALVLADTHLRPGGTRKLPGAVLAAAAQADVILHAGDVLTAELLADLARSAPVHAVLGNNDHALVDSLPETLQLDLAGVRVAMIHDAGPRVGRPGRMRRRFPDAQLVVYGHSHLPDDSEGIGGQWLFNPGSCTERRRAPYRTYGLLDLGGGRIRSTRIVALEDDDTR
jgi:putative phosphoesterase